MRIRVEVFLEFDQLISPANVKELVNVPNTYLWRKMLMFNKGKLFAYANFLPKHVFNLAGLRKQIADR